MKSNRLDPIFQTEFKQIIRLKGRVIGEVYILPQNEVSYRAVSRNARTQRVLKVKRK